MDKVNFIRAYAKARRVGMTADSSGAYAEDCQPRGRIGSAEKRKEEEGGAES
jgi:hypothetical protein